MAQRHMIKCLKCGYTVYSRAHHDLNFCPCKSVGVDGGRAGYVRGLGSPDNQESLGVRETVFTEHQLYVDWNLRIDLLGSFPDTAIMEMLPTEWEAKAWEIWKDRCKKK